MRTPLIIRTVVLAISLWCVYGQSFAQTVKRSDSGTAQPAAKRQGFFDYALGKINPRDTDYGAAMESGRAALVENSVDDLYFWSNVVTLLLLSGLVAVVLLQWRAADKREVIAASLIAQLWNGRVSDRIEIDRRTEQFNRLVEAHNAEAERALSAKPQPASGEEQADSELKRTVEGLDKRTTKVNAADRNSVESRSPNLPTDNQAAEATASGLQQRNIILERQAEAMRNTEANLRRRLNDTMAQLDQERNRNQTLKGA
jgi:hypothetical protein